MDKVIIFGIYHFLGFGLCLQLLEEGILVDGYRFEKSNDEEFLDDKRLMIGRNANYHEQGESIVVEVGEQNNISEIVIVASFYDFYFSKAGKQHVISQEKIFDEVLKLHSNYYPNAKIVCLFPDIFLHEFPALLKERLHSLKNKNLPYQSIYIPTVFGPWQPSTFFYHQLLLKQLKNTEPYQDERETTTDALFITDVVAEIISQLQSTELKDIKLESNEKEKWIRGVRYLSDGNCISMKKEKKVTPDLLDVHKIKITEKTSIKNGIDEQKNHLSRLIKKTF